MAARRSSSERTAYYDILEATQEVCSMDIEYEGGKQLQYPALVVSKVDFSSDADGKAMYDVEFVALAQAKL